MATHEENRAALRALVRAARSGDASARRDGLAWLLERSGHEWLSLDENARQSGWRGAIVSGRGWDERRTADDSELLIDVVVSWHGDGRLREQATHRLAADLGRISAAGLAVRSLDHVEQVREEALRGLLLQTDEAAVDAVVAVLAAGSARRGAPAVLEKYTDQLLTTSGGAERLLSYLRHADRGVSRWAVTTALDRRLLLPEKVFELTRTHTDQLIRVRCAEWLTSARPEMLVRLLEARSAEVRLVALRQVPDQDLSETRLRLAVLDRSSRVRAVAQERSRDRGLDAAEVYRAHLQRSEPTTTAVALQGLSAVGTALDAPSAVRLLAHERPAVRAAAVLALAALASAEGVITLVTPLLEDPSRQVIAASTRALVRVDAGAAVATSAWNSREVVSRRAAWRVSRAASGWDRVVADLTAANDIDPDLAENGKAGLKNWMDFRAARTWQQPTAAQQASIINLLVGSGMGKGASRQLVFHAGLRRNAPRTIPIHEEQPEAATPATGWRRLMRYAFIGTQPRKKPDV